MNEAETKTIQHMVATTFWHADGKPMSAQQFMEYVKEGVGELDQDKLAPLMRLKYHAIPDALEVLGTAEDVRSMFAGFQQYLYARGERVA